MNTVAFATVLAIYAIVLYLAQSPVSRNRRNRIAFARHDVSDRHGFRERLAVALDGRAIAWLEMR
jgi:hypothetical protein